MKILLTAVIFFLAFHFCYARNTTNWYKVFTGKFGNVNATLHLCKYADNYSGYIWFDKLQWPMQILSGQKITNTDSINMSAASGPLSVNITGVLSDNDYIGYCNLEKDYQPSKKEPFHLIASTDKGYTTFNYFFTKGDAALSAKLKNDSHGEFSLGTVWPKENNSLSNSLKKEISLLLKIKSPVQNIQNALNASKDHFLSAWQKENNKLTPKDASEMGMSLSVSEDENIMVMYENERTITLADFGSAYTGGAHANFSTSLINFEKKSGKTLRLKDVLTPEGIKILPAYLNRVARMQYGITNQKPLDENNFFVKQITPTENFYITSAGIGFLYPPYELKSFADGEINLLVPITVLGKYLQPAFKN